mgnify:CR=1 FL=1
MERSASSRPSIVVSNLRKSGEKFFKKGGGGGMPSMAKMNQMYEQILKETLKDFG